MKNSRLRLLSSAAGLLLAVAFVFSAANAQVDNQATEVTFQQPVRVPGQVLPPGTYWFTVLNSGATAGLNRVQIKNADGTKVIALFDTATANHAQEGQYVREKGVTWPSGKVVLTFAEGRKGEPVTLLTWFYPGRTDGHRFVYSDRVQKQIDEEQHKTLAFNPGDKITIGRSLAAFE
ncbi:MAG TPA: hypothetical protein VG322_13740 [Candidatus Acidoferrales bacterium]|jgi:hypothetical protein|nr:hypothetical protein [Candidatus Acidoferrales bacterium]